MFISAELVAGMLAHMAVDRSISHSLSDAREAVCKSIIELSQSDKIFSLHMLQWML